MLVWIGVRSNGPPRGATAPSALPVAASDAPEPEPDVASTSEPPEDRPALDPDMLAHFRDSLRDVRAHARREHVHVLFFGDSHAASDLWSGPLHRALADRFGDGGPGYLFAGLREHPNDGIGTTTDGVFAERPKAPSSSIPSGDGLYGLGGVLSVADHGTATVTLIPRHVARTIWDVCYRGARHGDVDVSVSGATAMRISNEDDAVQHRVFVSGSPGAITLDVSGDAALCGAIAERDPKETPGVVVDTLGINGARFTTALSWDKASFSAEVARRRPDLVILEYGTNESAEKDLEPDAYERAAGDLMARVRAASPDASCVAVGPTEIEAHPEGARVVSGAIARAAATHRCAYWSPYDVMGGAGAMRAWRASDPPLAQSDGIHLTAAGYAKLADALFHDLVAGLEE